VVVLELEDGRIGICVPGVPLRLKVKNVMATIAACPHCYTQLGLPEMALETDVAQCPQCSGEFRLAEVRPLPLLEARIVAAPAKDALAGLGDEPARYDTEGQAGFVVPKNLIEPAAKSPAKSVREPKVESAAEPADDPLTMPSFDFPKWELPTSAPEITSSSAPVVAELSMPKQTTVKSNLNLTALRPRRRTSKIRLATGVVGGGALGCFLGLYGLLWVRGASADYLELARYLPEAMLPPSMRSLDETETETNTETKTVTVTEENNTDVSQDKALVVRRDDEVQPATATEPVQPTPPLTAEIPAAEFVQLLAAAQEAQPKLAAGDFNDPETQQIKVHAYMAMCRLAEKIDTVADPNSAGDMQQATALFRWALIRAQLTNDLGQITSSWWEHTDRPSQGIFFVGQVQSVQPLGDQFLCQIATGEGQSTSTLPVLLPESSLSEGQRVGIVGVIIANPQQHLAEFEGDETQIIAATRIFPLDTP